MTAVKPPDLLEYSDEQLLAALRSRGKSSLVVQDAGARRLAEIPADAHGNVAPSQLIIAALDRGIPAESLEKLVALQERMEARVAATEFEQALAKFRKECPSVFKTKRVEIEKRDGSTYGYDYAPLEDIMPAIEPHLAANGFSISWDRRCDKPGFMTSVCTLRHLNGHSRTSSFELPTESANPGMSIQQKYGGAATFADRKTLQAVLGIVAGDEDKAATQAVDPTPISDDQRTAIEDLLAAATKGKPATKVASIRARFLKYLDVKEIKDIRAVDYEVAVNSLQPQPERQ